MSSTLPPMDPAAAAELLGVEPDDELVEIVLAHRRYVWENHPDSGGDGADLARAARARDVLVERATRRLQRRAALRHDDHHVDRAAGRTRTFHRSTPWWQRLLERLIPWRSS